MKTYRIKGIIISYFNFFLNILINIFITPLLIEYLSDDNYSIYKVIHAYAAPLIIFNIGLSTIVTRSIVKYKLKKEDVKEKQNIIALSLLISIMMAFIVIVISKIMYGNIDNIYYKTYDKLQIEIAKKIFLILIISTIFNIISETFNGCVWGNEKYQFISIINTITLLTKALLLIICITLKVSVVGITLIDLAISIIKFILLFLYSICILKEFPKLSYINKSEIYLIISYSASIILQSIVNQINNNMDLILLGAVIEEKRIITMYSSALSIYNIYNSLILVIANYYVPQANKLIIDKADGEELTDFVIKPGRLQAMIAIGIIFAFIPLGKNFIKLWIGAQYIESYYLILALIIPITIPAVQETAIALLDASLKRIYRSVVLFIMSIINVIVSVISIKNIGFWGAAIGTVISIILGHIILMNIYYAKVFKLNIKRMFIEIFKGILPVGVFSCIIIFFISFILPDSPICFIIKCLLFIIVYLSLLWFIGLNDHEKEFIKLICKKLKRRQNQ